MAMGKPNGIIGHIGKNTFLNESRDKPTLFFIVRPHLEYCI